MMSSRVLCLLATFAASPTPAAAVREGDADYAFGFLLACVAGAATVLGVGFIPLTAVMDRKKVISAALAFAAGVMIWVGFMEAFAEEAREMFEEYHHHGGHDDHDHRRLSAGTSVMGVVRRLHGGAEVTEEEFFAQWLSALFFFVGAVVTVGMDKFSAGLAAKFAPKKDEHEVQLAADTLEKAGGSFSAPASGHGHDHGQMQGLAKVSIVAFLALTLHNLPEGFATLFGGASGNFGIVIAIALHNLPEGAAVAVPCYEASGQKWGPPLIATGISALAQPVGAGIGWIVILATGMSDDDEPFFLFGTIYSVVAGIMVTIAIMELIPEALEMGQTALYVALWVFVGMLVMELTLIFWSALNLEDHEHDHDHHDHGNSTNDTASKTMALLAGHMGSYFFGV